MSWLKRTIPLINQGLGIVNKYKSYADLGAKILDRTGLGRKLIGGSAWNGLYNTYNKVSNFIGGASNSIAKTVNNSSSAIQNLNHRHLA